MSGKLIQIGDKACVVFETTEGRRCYEDWCTHLGGPLSEGVVEGGVVTCPWHGAKFDTKTGAVLLGPATRALKTVSGS